MNYDLYNDINQTKEPINVSNGGGWQSAKTKTHKRHSHTNFKRDGSSINTHVIPSQKCIKMNSVHKANNSQFSSRKYKLSDTYTKGQTSIKLKDSLQKQRLQTVNLCEAFASSRGDNYPVKTSYRFNDTNSRIV